MVRPDYRKSLEQLHAEWRSCQECELGKRREAVGGNFVAGEGARHAVMFIGEGPGKTEEREGRPFVGKSGEVLRKALFKLHLPSYITNVVTCRSCSQAYDTEGNPKYQKDWATGKMVPRIQDSPPTPSQVAACLPRLYEEIYLVDPVLIIALGAEAAKALSRGAVSFLAETGVTKEIIIPGAGYHPALTEKKKVWARKMKGQVILPVERNAVRYLMMPLLHPAYLLRRHEDARHGNPVEMFTAGMQKASDIYRRYVQEAHGKAYEATELTRADVMDVIRKDEQDG